MQTNTYLHDAILTKKRVIDQFEGEAGESESRTYTQVLSASAIAWEGSALTRMTATQSATQRKRASLSALFRVDSDGCIERDKNND